MKITVAGVVKEVKDNITISELIAQENVETPEYVTVSVNDEFAKSADFETQQLKDCLLYTSERLHRVYPQSR